MEGENRHWQGKTGTDRENERITRDKTGTERKKSGKGEKTRNGTAKTRHLREITVIGRGKHTLVGRTQKMERRRHII